MKALKKKKISKNERVYRSLNRQKFLFFSEQTFTQWRFHCRAHFDMLWRKFWPNVRWARQQIPNSSMANWWAKKNKNICYFVIQYFCCFSQNLWCIVRWTCTTWPCFHKQAIGGLSLSIYIPLRLLIDIFSGRASTIMRRRDVNCVLRRSIPVWRSGRLAFFFCTAQNTQTTRLYDKEKIYRFLIV